MKPMTVKDLKKQLSRLSDDLMVGVTGHFGEFYPLEQDYAVRSVEVISPNPWGRTQGSVEYTGLVVVLTIPDIGAEPD